MVVFFFKVGICIDVETWEKKVPLSFCIPKLSLKLFLYIFEEDPLHISHIILSDRHFLIETAPDLNKKQVFYKESTINPSF